MVCIFLITLLYRRIFNGFQQFINNINVQNVLFKMLNDKLQKFVLWVIVLSCLRDL